MPLKLQESDQKVQDFIEKIVNDFSHLDLTGKYTGLKERIIQAVQIKISCDL